MCTHVTVAQMQGEDVLFVLRFTPTLTLQFGCVQPKCNEQKEPAFIAGLTQVK